MSGAELVVDDTPRCDAGWGHDDPMNVHYCERPPEHDGRHVCICGSWRKADG